MLSQKYAGLYVKYRLFLSNFNGNWIFSTDFRKLLKFHGNWFLSTDFRKILKFHGNPCRGIRVVPCVETHRLTDGRTDWQTGMTELIVAFCNFANAPKEDARLHSRKNMAWCLDVKDINIGGGYACFVRLMCSVLAWTCTLMVMATDLGITVRVVRH
jgi:hypothetical protein